MYEVEFIKTVNGTNSTLALLPTNGYYVANIDGLTGISSNLTTADDYNGRGVHITAASSAAKTITVRGYILDKQTTKKQDMLNFFKPAQKMRFAVRTYTNGGSASQALHRKYLSADVVVKTTPVITQERHSQYVIELSMPFPYFVAETQETLSPVVNNGFTDGTEVTVLGDIEPEFEWSFKATNNVTNCSLIASATQGNAYATDRQLMMLNFANTNNGKLVRDDTVRVWRDNGQLRAEITHSNNTTENAIGCVTLGSRMVYLPLGTWYMWTLETNSYITNSTVKYYPAYSGVLAYGV